MRNSSCSSARPTLDHGSCAWGCWESWQAAKQQSKIAAVLRRFLPGPLLSLRSVFNVIAAKPGDQHLHNWLASFNLCSTLTDCACRQMQHREWAEVSPRLPQISHRMPLCQDTESLVPPSRKWWRFAQSQDSSLPVWCQARTSGAPATATTTLSMPNVCLKLKTSRPGCDSSGWNGIVIVSVKALIAPRTSCSELADSTSAFEIKSQAVWGAVRGEGWNILHPLQLWCVVGQKLKIRGIGAFPAWCTHCTAKR